MAGGWNETLSNQINCPMGRVLLRRFDHLHGPNCRLVVVGRTGRAAFNARPSGTDPKANKKETK